MNENKDDLTLSKQIYEETFFRNPVLISVVGLCPVVAISTTLKSALILSGITFLILLIAEFFAASIFRHVPQWIRIGLYTITGMLIVSPIMFLLNQYSPDVMLALGIYLPLMAINPLIVRQCERDAIDAPIKQVFKSTISVSIAYSLVLIAVGFLRELLGSGAIWGHKVFSTPAAVSLNMPFGGFLIIGFLAALLRVYIKRKDPEYEEELTFNSRISLNKKKPPKDLKKDILDDEIDIIPFMAKKIINESHVEQPNETVNESQQKAAQKKPDEKIQEETQNQETAVNLDEIDIDAFSDIKDTVEEQIINEEPIEDIIKKIDQGIELNKAEKVEVPDLIKDTQEEVKLPDLIKDSHKEEVKAPDFIKDSHKEEVKEPELIIDTQKNEVKVDLNQEPQPEILPIKDDGFNPEIIINEMINEIKTDKKEDKKQKHKKTETEERVILEKTQADDQKSNKIEYTSKELENLMSKSLDDLVTGIKDDKKNKNSSDKEAPHK